MLARHVLEMAATELPSQPIHPYSLPVSGFRGLSRFFFVLDVVYSF